MIPTVRPSVVTTVLFDSLKTGFCVQIAAVRKLETIPAGATRSLERELHHQELLYLEPDTDEQAVSYAAPCVVLQGGFVEKEGC